MGISSRRTRLVAAIGTALLLTLSLLMILPGAAGATSDKGSHDKSTTTTDKGDHDGDCSKWDKYDKCDKDDGCGKHDKDCATTTTVDECGKHDKDCVTTTTGGDSTSSSVEDTTVTTASTTSSSSVDDTSVTTSSTTIPPNEVVPTVDDNTEGTVEDSVKGTVVTSDGEEVEAVEELPFTGSEDTALLVIGLIALALGSILVVSTRTDGDA